MQTKFTKEYLEGLTIHDLRAIYRNVFACAPNQKSKSDLIEEILSMQNGELSPKKRTNRGRKPLYSDPSKMEYTDDSVEENTDNDCYGVLELCPDGYGFLRGENYEISKENDIFVAKNIIRAYNLREGDIIQGICAQTRDSGQPSLQSVTTVNGRDNFESRPVFDNLTPCYPDERITLELENSSQDLSIRCIDLLCPIGKGQRGLIVAPPKTGKTTLLKKIANSIEQNYGDKIKLMVLLIDERPEEVTDIKESVNGEIIYSTFDETPEHHIKVANLAIQSAKRLVESGYDVVLLLDSITKLTRAYNVSIPSSGRTLSGGLDPACVTAPKKFFGSARNVRGKGSLTILATALVETGSRMDEVIYEEFKGTGNMEIMLSGRLSERRVFPAIDLYKSGTRREELLLSKDELDCAYKVRKLLQEDPRASENFLEMLSKTKNNLDFISKIDDWLKIYKN